ncbi:MAG: F-box protein [Chlamydiae bacterium]|nr:F-box protein [Chlamydiota bacterium]
MSGTTGATEGPKGTPSHTVQKGKELVKHDPVTRLTFEVFSKIVSYLTPKEANVARLVSRVWNSWTTSAFRSAQLVDMNKFLTVVATSLKGYPQVVQKCLSLIKPNDVLKSLSLLSLKENFLSLRDYLVEALVSVSKEGLLALHKALEPIKKPVGLEHIHKIAIEYKDLADEKTKPVRPEKTTILTTIASKLIDYGAFSMAIGAINLIPEESSKKELYQKLLTMLEKSPIPYLDNLSEILQMMPTEHYRYYTVQIDRLRSFSEVDHTVKMLTMIYPPFGRITNRDNAFYEILDELKKIPDVNKALEIALAIPNGSKMKLGALDIVLRKLLKFPDFDKALKIAEQWPDYADDCIPKIIQVLALSTNGKREEMFTKIEGIKDDKLREKILFTFLKDTVAKDDVGQFFAFFNKSSLTTIPPEAKDEIFVGTLYDLVSDGNVDQAKLFLERLFSDMKSRGERDVEKKFYQSVVSIAKRYFRSDSSKLQNLGLFFLERKEMEQAEKIAGLIEDPQMKSELLKKIAEEK